MKCTACGKEQAKKELVFTEDKVPYCSNPFQCNDLHPNSVKNIVARGGAIELYTEDQLEVNYFERMDISDELKDRIQKVATKPQSIRLSKFEIAHYLIQLQEAKEFSSISEAVRYCVTKTMQDEPFTHTAPTEEPKKDEIKIPDIPKSVNVNWDELPKGIEMPKAEEEDEFEF